MRIILSSLRLLSLVKLHWMRLCGAKAEESWGLDSPPYCRISSQASVTLSYLAATPTHFLVWLFSVILSRDSHVRHWQRVNQWAVLDWERNAVLDLSVGLGLVKVEIWRTHIQNVPMHVLNDGYLERAGKETRIHLMVLLMATGTPMQEPTGICPSLSNGQSDHARGGRKPSLVP